MVCALFACSCVFFVVCCFVCLRVFAWDLSWDVVWSVYVWGACVVLVRASVCGFVLMCWWVFFWFIA